MSSPATSPFAIFHFTQSHKTIPHTMALNIPWQHPSPKMLPSHHLATTPIFVDGVLRLCKLDFCPDFALIYLFKLFSTHFLFSVNWKKLTMTWQSHFAAATVFNQQFHKIKFDIHFCCRVLPFYSITSSVWCPSTPTSPQATLPYYGMMSYPQCLSMTSPLRAFLGNILLLPHEMICDTTLSARTVFEW